MAINIFQNKSRSIKQELKENKKKVKNTTKIYNKIKSTLDWCDIKKISDQGVFLGKDLKTVVKGIKLTPKNLFLDTLEKQQFFINTVRTSLNNFNFDVFFSFVYIPINFDQAKALIFSQQKENRNNRRILNLLQHDEEKIDHFKRSNYEVEFHIYVRDHDPKHLERKFASIITEFTKMGLYDRVLIKRDYLNYINYLFENPLINDFYFTRGIFRWLPEAKFMEEHQVFESFEDESEDFTLTLGIDDDINIRSRFVPTGYNISSSYITVGDKYVSNVLVTKLPPRIGLGFLSGFISNPLIKCFMTLNTVDFNLSNVIKKDYNEKYTEFQKTFDPTKRTNLEKELLSLDEYLKRSIANNDKTFNLTLVFSIYADDLTTLKELKKELVDTLYSQDIAVFKGLYMQDQLFRIANPFLLESKLPMDVKRNIGIPMSSETVAGLHPYIFETLKDKKGFLFARDYFNSGVILFDQFFYLNQKGQSGKTARINGNLALVGKSGSGKTTAMSLLVRNHIRFGHKIVWIDPENKNKKLTKVYGGTYIEYGARGNIINVFDLKPVTLIDNPDADQEDELTQEEMYAMYDTALAIKNVTSDVSYIFNYLFKTYTDEEAAMTSILVPLVYEKVGIQKNEQGVYPSFKTLTSKHMPTFSDFEAVIDACFTRYQNDPLKTLELEALKSLKLKVSRITGEWSVYFDGQSTYQDSKILAFGTKMFFDMEDNLKNALTHIIFKKAWGECSKDTDPTVIIVDEAHMFISEVRIAKILSNISRRARKYSSALIIGTQEPKDFADDKVLVEGKAIFNNCAYKLIMMLDQDPALELGKLIRINESEFEAILGFELGGGLFVIGNHKVPISVLATENELKEIE